MENASKALIMAGGILLTMLLISLLIFAWGRFSDFYNNEDELAEIADLAKFNEQFTRYDRKGIHGYELISLANKIADYNFRFSNAVDSKNDKGYVPVKMTIEFPGSLIGTNKSVKDSIWYGDGYRHLFRDNSILEQSSIKNQIVGEIINPETNIEKIYRDTSVVSKLAKNIDSLIVVDKTVDYYMKINNLSKENATKVAKEFAKEKYNSIVGTDNKASTYEEVQNHIFGQYDIRQYYEYYQFKKAIFDITPGSITYDDSSGRVKTIGFIFTGNIE